MSTPLLQATGNKLTASRPDTVSIQQARTSSYSDAPEEKFQLAKTDTRQAAKEIADPVDKPRDLTDTQPVSDMQLTEMDPVSAEDILSDVTSADQQPFIGITLLPVTPSSEAAQATGSLLAENPAATAVVSGLTTGKLDKQAKTTVSDALFSPTSVANYAGEKLSQQTAMLSSASESNTRLQLNMPVNETITLSNSQISKEILPSAPQDLAISPTHHTLHNTSHPSMASQAQGTEWASIKVDTSAAKWGEQMMQVLHDRVTLQAQQNMQEAKIRLDPPELGKMNLIVRVEGDTLNVQINANAASTREALVQVSDRLRAELQNQNFINVNVNVGSDGSSQQQTAKQAADEITVFSARDTRTSSPLSNLSEHWLSTQA